MEDMEDRFKLRLWDGTTMWLKNPNYRSWYDAETKDCPTVSLHTHTLPQFALMQSTGLRDRNNKLIYEGDIIKYDTHYYGKQKERIKAVEWRVWDSDDLGEPTCLGFSFQNTNCEVIGNIYENPNLLEKKL